MMVSTLIILVFGLVAGIRADDLPSISEILNSQLCAICDGEDSIDDCNHFHLCNKFEKCYLQVFLHDGKKKYYGGCTNQCNDHRYFTSPLHKRNDILTDNNKPEHKRPICGQCCTGDNCNVHLCGAKDSIESKQMCAICRETSSLEDCKHFHLCDPGQNCYLQTFSKYHHGRLETKYYGGCTSSCSGNNLIPKHHDKREDFLTKNQNPNFEHHGQQSCGHCCKGENCNIHLCGSKSNVIFCAACKGVSTVDECLQREECPGDECYMDVLEGIFLGTKKVYAGCATNNECISHFGKSKRQFEIFGARVPLTEHGGMFVRTCGKCCHDGNHCNLDVCAQKTTTKAPTSTAGTTHMKTTQKLTTPQPLKVTSMPVTKQTTVNVKPGGSHTTQPLKASTVPISQQPTTVMPSGSQTKTVTPLKVSSVNPTASTTQNQGNTTHPNKYTISHVSMSTKSPLQCYTCSGPTCVILPGDVMPCNAGSAGCMNTVEVDVMGGVTVTKRCVTSHQCHTKWYLETSDSAKCMAFNINQIYSTAFTCHYCCTGDACNSNIIPDHSSLYKGR